MESACYKQRVLIDQLRAELKRAGSPTFQPIQKLYETNVPLLPFVIGGAVIGLICDIIIINSISECKHKKAENRRIAESNQRSAESAKYFAQISAMNTTYMVWRNREGE